MGPNSNEYSCVATLVKTSFIASTTFFSFTQMLYFMYTVSRVYSVQTNSLACLHYIRTIFGGESI